MVETQLYEPTDQNQKSPFLWMYGQNEHTVATLSKSYLITKGFTMPSLKSIGQFIINNKSNPLWTDERA